MYSIRHEKYISVVCVSGTNPGFQTQITFPCKTGNSPPLALSHLQTKVKEALLQKPKLVGQDSSTRRAIDNEWTSGDPRDFSTQLKFYFPQLTYTPDLKSDTLDLTRMTQCTEKDLGSYLKGTRADAETVPIFTVLPAFNLPFPVAETLKMMHDEISPGDSRLRGLDPKSQEYVDTLSRLASRQLKMQNAFNYVSPHCKALQGLEFGSDKYMEVLAHEYDKAYQEAQARAAEAAANNSEEEEEAGSSDSSKAQLEGPTRAPQ